MIPHLNWGATNDCIVMDCFSYYSWRVSKSAWCYCTSPSWYMTGEGTGSSSTTLPIEDCKSLMVWYSRKSHLYFLLHFCFLGPTTCSRTFICITKKNILFCLTIKFWSFSFRNMNECTITKCSQVFAGVFLFRSPFLIHHPLKELRITNWLGLHSLYASPKKDFGNLKCNNMHLIYSTVLQFILLAMPFCSEIFGTIISYWISLLSQYSSNDPMCPPPLSDRMHLRDLPIWHEILKRCLQLDFYFLKHKSKLFWNKYL